MSTLHPLLTTSGALQSPPQAVLFDLDGTFADTAPDLAAPANSLRADRGLDPLPVSDLRRFASSGARGLLGRALDVHPEHDQYEPLRIDFLRRYEQALCVHTRLFDGMEDIIATLEARAIPWGIVSNKVERYVRPIMVELGLIERSACAIGGDTAAHPKPHPAPLLHAAKLIGVDPRQCVYVGDDLRDIEAGRAAGMVTIAAAYGYCGTDDPPHAWGADLIIDEAAALGPWLSQHT